MALENVIIAYTADISDIKRQVTQITAINKQLAGSLSSDFSKGFSVINSQLKKVQFNKEFKIKIDDKKFKKVRGTISTFEKTVQSADGQVFKFTETIGKSGTATVKLSSSINQVAIAQNKLIGTSSKLGTNFKNLNNVNSTFAKQLGTLGKATKLVGTTLNQVSDTGSKTTKVFELVNGKFAQLTQTTKRLPGGIQTVTRSIKQLSKAQAESANTIERNGKSTRGFTANLKTLVGRALLTIPVWFALRTSIQTVFRTIREGLTDLASFDRALQKLGRNLRATSNDFDSDFKKVEKTITDFSLKTGKSVEEVTNAIQKFATVGFDTETSIVGGLGATKLAITLFGNAEETAQAFARSLRVLTEGMDDNEEKQRAIAEALAFTDQLWQTNAFEVNEFSNNLTKFAGSAKIANLSIKETLTLLATLSTGGLGNTSGRLLTGTILRALKDIPKITQVLGLDFDPKTQSTNEFILELVNSLKKLVVTKNAPAELAEVLGEIFTIRSTKIIASLVALESTLKENLALVPDLNKFEETFEAQLKTVNRLVDRHKNLNKEIGKTFVTGLLGAGNYQKALEQIVKLQEILLGDTERIAGNIRNAFAIAGVTALALFQKQLLKILLLTANPIVVTAVIVFTAIDTASQIKRLADEAIQENEAFNEVGKKFAEQINKGISGELDLRSLEALIHVLEGAGDGDFGAFSIAEGSVESLLSTLREIVDVEKTIAKETENIAEGTKKDELGRKKSLAIAEVVLENQLELLRARGANESQILKATQAIRDQLGLEADNLDVLKEKLAIERAITEERRLENNQISDTSQKLADIGRAEGVNIASRIGDVLSGAVDFDVFERIGGRSLEVFKDKFSDIFKQQQDIRFLDQKGFRIPLELADQNTVRGDAGRIRTSAQIEQRRSEAFIKSLSSSSTNVNSNTLAVRANTISIENLIRNFGQGEKLRGTDAQRLLDFKVPFTESPFPQSNQPTITRNAFPQSKSLLEISVSVDGIERKFSGSDDAIRQLAQRVSIEVAQAVENKLVDDLNNNDSSPISQATDGRVENF